MNLLTPYPCAPMSSLTKIEQNLKFFEDDILEELLRDKRSPATRRGYESDLRIFFDFLELAINAESIAWFLNLTQFEAIRLVLGYKSVLRDRNLKANTINRKVAAVKSLVAYARRTGRCAYSLDDIEGERVKAYRDTTGVDGKAIAKMHRNSEPSIYQR